MTNTPVLLRSLVIYAVCLPLAIWLGYLLATPSYNVRDTIFTVAITLALLSIPLVLRWHYTWMIACWNMNVVLFFLPGNPAFWTLLILISFTISLLQFVLDRKQKFISVPSINRPLIFLLVVVLVTARFTGGIDISSLGGGDAGGGRRYVWLLIGLLGYFALAARRIPLDKAGFYITLFLIGFVSFAIGSSAGLINPNLNFIFLMFPADTAGYSTMMAGDAVSGPANIVRFGGVSTGAIGLIYLLLSRYGIEGVLQLRKLWRLALFAALLFVTLIGGYRSMAITVLLTAGILLYMEGLLRSQLLPMLVLTGVLAATLLFSFAKDLPLSVQRTLTFLPIEFSPDAEEDAKGTSEWRMTMWREVLPEVPEHLILGKGYGINKAELDQVLLAQRFHVEENSALGPKLAGDYHNGPLSVIIPFGVFGAIGFLWFLAAGARVLYRNYKFGDPALTRINRFLLAYFLMKIIIFFSVFGSLYSDFVGFTGVVGLSVALNGGASSPVPVPVAASAVSDRLRLAGAARSFRGIQ